jgi:hypothetical protein
VGQELARFFQVRNVAALGQDHPLGVGDVVRGRRR